MIPGLLLFYYQLFQWSSFVYKHTPPAPTVKAISQTPSPTTNVTPQITQPLPSQLITSTMQPASTSQPAIQPTTNPTNAPTAKPDPTTTPILSTNKPQPTTPPKPTNPPQPTTPPQPTQTPIPAQASGGSLVAEINTYRQSQGKATISSHGTLCSIAASRVATLAQNNALDNHQGISAYQDQIFTHFSQWWEVIFQASPAKSSQAVVTEGWANSPAHNESILSSEATHGCGAESNGFAVFILGKSK